MRDASIQCLETVMRNLVLASDAAERAAQHAGRPSAPMIWAIRDSIDAVHDTIKGVLASHRETVQDRENTNKVLSLADAIASAASHDGFMASAKSLKAAISAARKPKKPNTDPAPPI